MISSCRYALRLAAALAAGAALVAWCPRASATEWFVGPTRTYATPSAVATLVHDGDTVSIDAGTYDDCATWSANDLLIRGTGGRAHLHDAVCGRKGVFVLYGSRITIEDVELSGAAISSADGSNAAGVRAQGGSFVLRRCFIHDNQMGVLCSLTEFANVLIERSVIADNVSADESLFAHNIYVNTCDTFTLAFCFVYGAEVGHEVKSRARVNRILYNKIVNQTDSASRDVDLPNGGQALLLGNVIEKGPNAQNTNMIGFGLEGMRNPGPQTLTLASNTLVNDLPARGIAIEVPATGFDTLRLFNNLLAGPGVLLAGAPASLDSATNVLLPTVNAADFVAPRRYDFHLLPSSPPRDRGIDPGFLDGTSLLPTFEYADTAAEKPRPAQGGLDCGAFEYDGGSAARETATRPARFGISAAQTTDGNAVTLRFSRIPTSPVRLTVRDMLGRVCLSLRVGAAAAITLPASGLASGWYQVQARCGDAVAVTALPITR